jgi:hemolysin III
MLFGIFGTIALIAMVLRSEKGRRCSYNLWGCSIFGFSLLILYTVSTTYHATGLYMTKAQRTVYHILDHVAIFFMIAGTYTPITLHLMKKGAIYWLGIVLLIMQWATVVGGTALKLLVDIRTVPGWITNGLYLLMGWSVMFIIKPVYKEAPRQMLLWVVYGGLFYTFGVWFLTWEKLQFNHAIWHLFTTAGSFSHFVAVVVSAADKSGEDVPGLRQVANLFSFNSKKEKSL